VESRDTSGFREKALAALRDRRRFALFAPDAWLSITDINSVPNPAA
jgi:hypothetical protein